MATGSMTSGSEATSSILKPSGRWKVFSASLAESGLLGSSCLPAAGLAKAGASPGIAHSASAAIASCFMVKGPLKVVSNTSTKRVATQPPRLFAQLQKLVTEGIARAHKELKVFPEHAAV